MRNATCIAVALGVTMLTSATAHSAPIKLATWNRNNLHHVLGEPLRSNAPVRNEADYQILREYRDRLGADVIALQEVNGPKAAGRVFPPDQYDLYFSGRHLFLSEVDRTLVARACNHLYRTSMAWARPYPRAVLGAERTCHTLAG